MVEETPGFRGGNSDSLELQTKPRTNGLTPLGPRAGFPDVFHAQCYAWCVLLGAFSYA